MHPDGWESIWKTAKSYLWTVKNFLDLSLLLGLSSQVLNTIGWYFLRDRFCLCISDVIVERGISPANSWSVPYSAGCPAVFIHWTEPIETSEWRAIHCQRELPRASAHRWKNRRVNCRILSLGKIHPLNKMSWKSQSLKNCVWDIKGQERNHLETAKNYWADNRSMHLEYMTSVSGTTR